MEAHRVAQLFEAQVGPPLLLLVLALLLREVWCEAHSFVVCAVLQLAGSSQHLDALGSVTNLHQHRGGCIFAIDPLGTQYFHSLHPQVAMHNTHHKLHQALLLLCTLRKPVQQEIVGTLRHNTSMSIISHAWAAPAGLLPRRGCGGLHHSPLGRLQLLPLQLLDVPAQSGQLCVSPLQAGSLVLVAAPLAHIVADLGDLMPQQLDLSSLLLLQQLDLSSLLLLQQLDLSSLLLLVSLPLGNKLVDLLDVLLLLLGVLLQQLIDQLPQAADLPLILARFCCCSRKTGRVGQDLCLLAFPEASARVQAAWRCVY